MDSSPGFRSPARFRTLGGSGSQIPVRSGLPSDRRGAGAFRFGSPFWSRGIPLSVTFHWAASGAHSAAARNALSPIFSIELHLLRVLRVTTGLVQDFHFGFRASRSI